MTVNLFREYFMVPNRCVTAVNPNLSSQVQIVKRQLETINLSDFRIGYLDVLDLSL